MNRLDQLRNEIGGGGSVAVEAPEEEQQQPETSPAMTIVGLVSVVGLFAWLGFVNPWMLVFAIGILLSVFLHEAGHFITARLTGMKATQFFIGIGPRIWSFHRGETEYGLRAVPVAAYVRIIGMSNMDEVPPADEARTYRRQTYPRRMLVITAGSIMHIIIAIVLLFGVFANRGELREIDGARIAAIEERGAADRAGLEPNDVIVALDGEPIIDDEELGELVRSYSPGDRITVDYRRDGVEQSLDVALGRNSDRESEFFGMAMLGVGSGPGAEFREVSMAKAAQLSITELGPTTWQSTKGVFTVLNPVNIVSHVFGDNEDMTTRPTTLVGVTQVSGLVGDSQGFIGVVYLLAVLNVFVGVFNMFPLLPLDGGHAAIATYERVRSRRGGRYFADVSKMMPFAMAVMMVLLLLFMSGLYLDITKPLGG